MKVIISGASGFIGHCLAKECQLRGVEVVCIIHNNSSINERKNDNCNNLFYSDLLNNLNGNRSLRNADCFFHFAWSGTSGNGRNDLKLQLANINTLKECIKIAHYSGCRKFINAGSIMEAELFQRWRDSSSRYTLNDIYGVVKTTSDYLGRIFADDCGVNYINLVISNIYGPGERSERFVYSVLKKMLSNEMIPLTDCNQMYDFIYISDAVDAMIKIAESGKCGNYYIGNQRQKPLKNFVNEMKAVTGSASEIAFGELEKNSKDLSYDDLDCERIYRELNFRSKISFSEGIKKTAEYIRRIL